MKKSKKKGGEARGVAGFFLGPMNGKVDRND